jgi:hypothetical protein
MTALRMMLIEFTVALQLGGLARTAHIATRHTMSRAACFALLGVLAILPLLPSRSHPGKHVLHI